MVSQYKGHICIECGKDTLVTSNGFIVCRTCGTIQDKVYVDYSPILTTNSELIVQSSIGKNIDFVGALGSTIGRTSGFMREANGKAIQTGIVAKYKRLQHRHQNPARLKGNTTHLRTIIAFNRVFNSLEISNDVKYRSLFLYWKYVNSEYRITNHVLLIALCLLQAIREAGKNAPIRFSDVVNVFAKRGHRVTNKSLLRLAKELNVPLSANRRRAEDYIEKLASTIRNSDLIQIKLKNIGISPHQYEVLLIMISNEFLQKLSRKERGGVQPFPFAVSIIYLSDRTIAKFLKKKQILTQKELALLVNSAEFTIRDHVYRFLGDLYKKYEKFLISVCDAQLKKIGYFNLKNN